VQLQQGENEGSKVKRRNEEKQCWGGKRAGLHSNYGRDCRTKGKRLGNCRCEEPDGGRKAGSKNITAGFDQGSPGDSGVNELKILKWPW